MEYAVWCLCFAICIQSQLWWRNSKRQWLAIKELEKEVACWKRSSEYYKRELTKAISELGEQQQENSELRLLWESTDEAAARHWSKVS